MASMIDAQIRTLESCIAAGDVASMAHIIADLRKKWDSLEEPVQKDVLKLEAIFLSLVNVKAGVG